MAQKSAPELPAERYSYLVYLKRYNSVSSSFSVIDDLDINRLEKIAKYYKADIYKLKKQGLYCSFAVSEPIDRLSGFFMELLRNNFVLHRIHPSK